MDLIILGAGTGIPLTNFSSPSIAMKIKDRCTLFDIGPGTLHRLAKTGMSLASIDNVFITHFHPDHTADLIHLFFATRNPDILKNCSRGSQTGDTTLPWTSRIRCSAVPS